MEPSVISSPVPISISLYSVLLHSLCFKGCYPLDGDVTSVVVIRACAGYWVGHPLLLCGCHCPVRSGVCSLIVRVEAPRSVSGLCCEVGRIGARPRDLLSISLLELFTGECALLCHLSLIVKTYKMHCCWHWSWPCPICWNVGNWHLCSSGVVVIRPPAQIYHSIQVSEAILGAVMAAQTLAQPSACVHALTKPTPAKARLIPAVGGPMSLWMSCRC